MQKIPKERDPIVLADWMERQALYSGINHCSFEELKSIMEVDGTLAEEALKSKVQPDVLSEQLIVHTEKEIRRRKYIVRKAYPFNISEGVLYASAVKKYLSYIFCLLISDREYYSSGDLHSPKLFEHLVGEASKSYLGGEAMRFGAYREPPVPLGIFDATDYLAFYTGNEKLENGYPVNATDKDLGLDIVAWKFFPDKYWGKVELFIQCTTEQEWEASKGKLSLDKWRNILRLPFNPIEGLAIPYVLPPKEWQRQAGILVLDRLRIASVLKSIKLPDDIINWWKWCQTRLSQARQSISLH